MIPRFPWTTIETEDFYLKVRPTSEAVFYLEECLAILKRKLAEAEAY